MEHCLAPEQARLWQRAASFAAWRHHGQMRKDGRTPYFAHCVRVAMTVRHVFECDDEVTLAAALLHDTIEDTTADFDDLVEECGEEVAEIVAALTKDMRLPEDEREKAYDENLAKASWKARLIKLADVFDNVIDCPSEMTRRKAVEKAHRALKLAANDPQAEKAREIVSELVRNI